MFVFYKLLIIIFLFIVYFQSKGLMLKKSLTNKVLTSTYDEEVDLLKDKELVIKRKYLTLKLQLQKSLFTLNTEQKIVIKNEFDSIVKNRLTNDQIKIDLLEELIKKYNLTLVY